MTTIAGHVLHLNLNTTDLATGAGFYESLLGLSVRMKIGSDNGDWTFHGISEPVSSTGWFLYDDRGPRAAPALELVEWRAPATAGSTYREFAHRGMGSLHFRVPSIDGLAAAAEQAGGTVVGTLDGDGLLVRDPDGVHVELSVHAGTDAPATARLAGARIGCADLEVSLAWFARLGFAATTKIGEHTLYAAGTSLRYRSAKIALPEQTVEFELTQWLDPVADEPAEGRLWHRGMIRMALSVEDLDFAMDALRAAGLDCPPPQYFALPGTAIGGLRSLFLTDPDGFTVELVHRPARYFRSPETRPATKQPERIALPGHGLNLAVDRWSPPDGSGHRGTVVLLHGGGQTRHSWHNTARRLAENGWVAYTVDARGHGDSDWAPDGDYSMDALIADLRSISDHVDEPPVVIGASMGGTTCLVAEGEQPFARAIVLVDVAPRIEPAGIERITTFMRSAPNGFATLEDAAAAVRAYNPHRRNTGSTEGLRRNLRRGADGRWRWHWDPAFMTGGDEPRRQIDRERPRTAARRITIPVLLVRGTESDIVSAAGAEEFAALVPGARLAVAAGAGHMVAGDDNDFFSRRVLEFLDQDVSPATTRATE